MTTTDSKTISFLKFTLLFGVIFVHMNPRTEALCDISFKILSTKGITNFISIFISYVWAFSAVPTYFLLSGYLFWKEGTSWDWQRYWKKIKSRVNSLLVPYLLWNILSISTFVIAMIVEKQSWSEIIAYLSNIGVRGFWNYCVWGAHKTNWLGWSIPNSGPFAIHLWFIRDLIVAILISPAIYWILKKTKTWGLGVLCVCYCSKIWPQIDGFGIDAIFFFATGMYIAMNGLSLTCTAQKIKTLVYLGALFLSCICTYYNGVTTHIGRLWFPFFAICATWTYINIGASAIKKIKITIPGWGTIAAFFVYALHACPIATIGSPLSKINTILINLLCKYPGGGLLYFLSSPFITTVFCLIVFTIVRYLSPTCCNLLTGKKTF